jgi:hypothetical protein
MNFCTPVNSGKSAALSWPGFAGPATDNRRSLLVGAVIFAVWAGLLLVGATPAGASDPPGMVLTTDSDGEDAVAVADADDGGFTGSLTLTNVSDTDYTVSAKGSEAIESCALQMTPDTVPSGRSITVKLTSPKPCVLSENGEEAVLTFVAGAGQPSGDLTVTLVPEEATDGVDLETLLPPFIAAGVLAFLVLGALYLSMPSLEVHTKTDGEPQDGEAKGAEVEKPPVTTAVGWTTPVEGVPAGWTFKDSWASNLSVGTTIFIALFGSKEVIEALLGDAPDDVLAELLLVGGVAGVLVGLAPLVLKTIGTSPLPTVGGLISAALFTLTGVTGQILAITWILKKDDLASETPTWSLPLEIVELAATGDLLAIIAVALVCFLLFYGFWTLRVLFVAAFPAPKGKTIPIPVVSDELLIAAAMAGHDGWDVATMTQRMQTSFQAASDYAADPTAQANPQLESMVRQPSPVDRGYPLQSGIL